MNRTYASLGAAHRESLEHIRAMLDAAHERRRAKEWLPRSAQLTPDVRAKLNELRARIAVAKANEDESYLADSPREPRKSPPAPKPSKAADKSAPGWASELTVGQLVARLHERGYNVTTQEMADAVGIAEHTDYAAWNAKFADRAAAGQAIWDYFGNHPELKEE